MLTEKKGGDDVEIVGVVLTALLSVAALFLITKCMGHKQVAQLDFFDYVNGITIGSIGAELATELEKPLKPLIALAVYGAVSIGLTLLTSKIPRTRKYINGTPSILFSGGKLYRPNLKKAKLDLSEFMVLCREQGYFDLDEIDTAVFEHNGKLSILPKAANRPLTSDDMHIPAKPTYIGVEVIMDGRVMGENLTRLGRDERWLEKRLKAAGFARPNEVFLAVFRKEEDRLTVYPIE